MSDVRLPIGMKRRLFIFRNPFPGNRQKRPAVKTSMIERRPGDPLLSQLDAAFQRSLQTAVRLQGVDVLLVTGGRFHLSSVSSSVCTALAEPVTPARKSPRRTGATALFEAPVRAWVGVGFHKPRTAPWGSLPSESILAGRRSSR